MRYHNAADIRTDLQRLKRDLGSAIAEEGGRTTASLPMALPRPIRSRRFGAIATVLTLVLALSATAAWWILKSKQESTTRPVGQDPQRRVLAVLPFENISKDPSQDYFSAGMTEEIGGQLSKIASLQVLSRTAVARYRDPRTNLRQIARDLGLGSVVLGSVRQEGSHVRIHVEVVDPRNDRTIWSEQYDRELKDIFEVQSDVALRIANALEATLSPHEKQRLEKPPTENMEAYQLYLRSQELNTNDRQKNLEAVQMLQQAVQMDPHFALAQARMAYRTMFQAYWDDPRYIDSGIEMAQKALALDPTLAAAHFAIAMGYYRRGQASNARLSLLKAIELDPNDSSAMSNLSLLESDLGHNDEALHWAHRGFRLEPNSSTSYYHVGIPLLFLGDDAVTERWLTEGEQHFPSSMRIQILLVLLDFQRGREQRALERAQKAVAAEPGNEELQILMSDLELITGAAESEIRVKQFFRSAPDLNAVTMILPESFRTRYAYLLARRGEMSRATKLMPEAERLARQTLHQGNEMPRVPIEIAAIYAVRQQKEPALEWVQRAYEAGWRDPRTLARDPIFDGLRAEPRFNELLGHMKRDIAAMRKRSSDLQEILTR